MRRSQRVGNLTSMRSSPLLTGASSIFSAPKPQAAASSLANIGENSYISNSNNDDNLLSNLNRARRTSAALKADIEKQAAIQAAKEAAATKIGGVRRKTRKSHRRRRHTRRCKNHRR